MEKRVKIWKLAMLFLGVVALSIPTLVKRSHLMECLVGCMWIIFVQWELPDGTTIYGHEVNCDDPGTNCMSITVEPD